MAVVAGSVVVINVVVVVAADFVVIYVGRGWCLRNA